MTDTAALKRVRLWAEHGLRSDLSDLVAAVSHIDALEAEVARLRSATILARDVFQHYGDLHAAKPDPEKAKRNYTMAAEMSAALGKQP